MCNLVFDIGNSLVKKAIFNGRTLEKTETFSFDAEKINHELKSNSQNVIMASVIHPDEIRKINQGEKYLLTAATPLPLKNNYQTPETLGHDRLANAAAIHHLSNGKNALAIDCGTCLKFDLVINGAYIGGSIAPGLKMRFSALHNFTGNLPLIEPEAFTNPVGKNTSESILAGCYHGMAAEIQQTINDLQKQYGELDIYFTGGDYSLFADKFKNCIFADPFLTLKGLNEILLFQNS